MKFLKLLVILILLSACNSNKSEFTIDSNYISEIDAFFDEKMKERQEDYLQLVALYRLNEGINSFGKDESNILVLNIDTLPETIGNILMNQDSLSFNAAENILIKTKEDSMVTNMPLKLNEYESSIKLYHNQLSWQIITRSKQHYLRVWNTQNPAIKDFKGFR